MNTYQVCLNIGMMMPVWAETSEGEWIDEQETLSQIRPIEESELTKACHDNLELTFDRDLDNPENFRSITAASLYGPKFAEYDESAGINISDTSFYLEVESESELTEDDIEDLFHLIEPVLEFDEARIAFGDFEDYSAAFEEIPEEGRKLNSKWEN